MLSSLSSLFVKISMCDTLPLHDLFNDWMRHTLTQGIRTIKDFFKYNSVTADKFIT